MATARGWTEADIRRSEAVFDGLVAKAVRMSLRSLTADLHHVTTAAYEPRLTFGQTGTVAATWNAYVSAELFPFVVQTFVDSADAVAEVTEEATGLALPAVEYSYAAGYLSSATNRLVGLGDQVWNAVREQLALGYDSGESIHQLAARVRSAADITEKRALTVARTEVASAANQGSLYQLLTAGFTDQECEKGWLATDDERTRLAHAAFLNPAHPGRWVGLLQPFIVGGEGLQCPGDPTGRPDNIINCRCTLEFRFHDDGPLTAGFSHNFRKWIEALHPRDDVGRFRGKGGGSLAPKFQPPQFSAPPKFKFKPAQKLKWKPSTPEPGAPDFHILPPQARGASGDGYYAPGMWGQFGAAGVMVRAHDPSGTERFLVVRRQGGKGHGKWQLAGGAIDQFETPEQGAARETFEELGVAPSRLAQLKRVGVHRSSQHVPGKTPWTYHSIAADAPSTFDVSNLDQKELSGAAWLTRAQLRMMKQHGLLVHPFAQSLESVLATFPDVHTASAQPAAFKWIEDEHPRDLVGRFADKIGDWITHDDASKMQHDMTSSHPWTHGQREAVLDYTGNSYVAMNDYLRGGHTDPSTSTHRQVQELHAAMRPLPRAVRVRRVVRPEVFAGVHEPQDLENMIGRTFEDSGFLSTTIKQRGTLPGHRKSIVLLELDVPAGTPSVYAGDMGRFHHAHEQELILDHGTRFTITHVSEEDSPDGGKQLVVHARVVPAPTTASTFGVLTAGLSAKQVKAMDIAAHELESITHGWNPKLHPRDPAGKFTFKGHGTPSIGGKPIKLNTKVIYSTKYHHGQVVAVKHQSGVTSEIRWNAHDKAPGSGAPGRFEIWSDYGHPEQGLAQHKILGKGQAYDALKGDTGWLEPITPTIASPPPFFSTPNAPAGPTAWNSESEMLSHWGTLSGQDLNVADVNEYFHGMTQQKWESLSLTDKDNALAVAEAMYDYQGQGSPKKILEGLYGQQFYEMQDEVHSQINDLLLPQNESEAIAAIQAMNGPEFLSFIEDNMDELQAMWPTASDKEKKALKDKAAKLQHMPYEQGFTPGSFDYLKAHDLLSQVETSNQGSSIVGDSSAIAAQIDHMSKEDFQTWMYDHIYPDMWDSGLTQAERDHVASWAKVWGLENVLTELANGGSGNLNEHGLTETQIQDFSNVVDSINNGLMSKDALGKWIDGSLTLTMWDTLTPDQQNALHDTVKKHGLTQKFAAKLYAVDVSTPTPVLPPSASHVATTAKVYDTGAVASAASIGVPKDVPDAGKYKTLTQQSAKKLQADMLQQSGKKWTQPELSAVSSYTTSVGYQTTNAVMRNDEKRMKLFTKAQLDAGYERAKRLQGAMTPLTESVTLHRGTGAQAFGFPGTHVSFAELKKLEGKVVTDDGFISTSVVEPTAHGVGFDYATKKPIKVIVRAPAGTPALYVSSATPGYSHENELILAAGTSLRLDSITPATAADKAKYGSQVEHVVVATVVPTPQHAPSAPHVSQPKAAAAPNVTSSLVNGDIGTGIPIKLNTKTIHTTTYKNGEIVAVHAHGSYVQQLYWDEGKKKFGIRSGPLGGQWETTQFLSKKDAYDTFKAEPNAVWLAPHPGSTINDEKDGPGASTPSATTVKAPKVTSVDIQAMHGQPPTLPDADFKQLIANIKYVSPLGEVKLGSQSPTIFKALAYAVAQHNRNNPNSPKLNLLQALKLLDAKSTQSGQPNKGLYEAKVVEWLQTAAGKKNAPSFVQWAEDLAHQPAAPKMTAVSTSVKNAYEIGTPDGNVTTFGNITVSTGTTMNAQQRAKYGAWTHGQVSAIQNYTGSGYGSINSSLRSGKPNTQAALIQSAMAPATRSFTVYRGTDGLGEAMKGHHTLAELKQLEGKTVTDPAFLSTSVGSGEAFSGKKFRLQIDVPEGTPVAYAYTVSSFKAEREMILAAGLKYRVVSVTKVGPQYVVRLRVVS